MGFQNPLGLFIKFLKYNLVAVIIDCINYFIIWLVGLRVFQLAVKLAKIFGRKWKLNWNVQASAPQPVYGNIHSTQEDQM